MLQTGVEIVGPQPGPRGAGQGKKEHAVGPGKLAVAGPTASEAAGAPDFDPVGRAVNRAPEEGRIHEGLRQQHVVTEAGRPS